METVAAEHVVEVACVEKFFWVLKKDVKWTMTTAKAAGRSGREGDEWTQEE